MFVIVCVAVLYTCVCLCGQLGETWKMLHDVLYKLVLKETDADVKRFTTRESISLNQNTHLNTSALTHELCNASQPDRANQDR